MIIINRDGGSGGRGSGQPAKGGNTGGEVADSSSNFQINVLCKTKHWSVLFVSGEDAGKTGDAVGHADC